VKKDAKLFVRSHSFAKGGQYFDGESLRAASQAPDGTIVAVGSVQHSATSGICSGCDAGHVVWMDGGGNVLRTGRYSPFSSVSFYDLDVRADGSVAAIGMHKSYQGKNARGVFARFDELGTNLVARDLYPSGYKPSVWRLLASMARYGKDKYVVAGYVKSGSEYFTWLQQIDATTGKQLSSPAYAKNVGAFNDVAVSGNGRIGAATDRGYVAVYEGTKSKAFIVNIQPITGRDIRTIVPTYDTGFAVAGWSAKGSFAAKINAANKVAWFREYDGGGADQIWGISRLPDGRFALAGHAYNAKNGAELRLLTLAADGGKLTDVLVSGSRDEVFYGLTTLQDGTLFAVGASKLQKQKYGYYHYDSIVARFSGWGHDKCVKAGFCADVTVKSCIDGNPCTIDSCTPGKGCTNAVVNDGTVCGTAKVCKSGKCG